VDYVVHGGQIAGLAQSQPGPDVGIDFRLVQAFSVLLRQRLEADMFAGGGRTQVPLVGRVLSLESKVAFLQCQF
jgi:hypothetical protein